MLAAPMAMLSAADLLEPNIESWALQDMKVNWHSTARRP